LPTLFLLLLFSGDLEAGGAVVGRLEDLEAPGLLLDMRKFSTLGRGAWHLNLLKTECVTDSVVVLVWCWWPCWTWWAMEDFVSFLEEETAFGSFLEMVFGSFLEMVFGSFLEIIFASFSIFAASFLEMVSGSFLEEYSSTNCSKVGPRSSFSMFFSFSSATRGDAPRGDFRLLRGTSLFPHRLLAILPSEHALPRGAVF